MGVVTIITSQDLSAEQKYFQLHQAVANSDVQQNQALASEIDRFLTENTQADEILQNFLLLIRIEIALSTHDSGSSLDALFDRIVLEKDFFKPIDDSSDASTILIKVIYNDLYIDYQYLIKPVTKNYRLVDLINKKLVLLGNIAGSNNQYIQVVVHEIYNKVIQYLLISGYDFRKQNLFNHLNEELGITSRAFQIDQPTLDVFKLCLGHKRIIPFDKFTLFINGCPNVIKHLDETKLIEYYIENNLALLPLYYKSIHIPKIAKLFNSTPSADYEKIISRMIVSDNLPSGTRIDQNQQLVVFPVAKGDYDEYDTKVHNVFKVVHSIVEKIE